MARLRSFHKIGPKPLKWLPKVILDKNYETARTTRQLELIGDPIWQSVPMPETLREVVLYKQVGGPGQNSFEAWFLRRVGRGERLGTLVKTSPNYVVQDGHEPIFTYEPYPVGDVVVSGAVRYLCLLPGRVIPEREVYRRPVGRGRSLELRALEAIVQEIERPPPEPPYEPPTDEDLDAMARA